MVLKHSQNIATKKEATPTLLPIRFVDAEVINTSFLMQCLAS
jgi:hypothetical protein